MCPLGFPSFGREIPPLRNYFEREHICLNTKIAIAYVVTEFLSLSGADSTIASAQQPKRPSIVVDGIQPVSSCGNSRQVFVTVKDAIEMTEFGDEDYLLGELSTD